MEAKKIVIIDDDPKIRAMLVRSLEFTGYQVFSAPDGILGWDLVMRENPHLIVLDVMLPQMNGFEICLELKNIMDTPILMLTAKDEIRDRVKGLDCGADDYLVKPFALDELLARIRALLRRYKLEGDCILEFSDLRMIQETRQVFRGTREIVLTAKEFDLLACFINHPRQVLTREKLMDSVWGYDYEGESNVLEVYIGYLRSKLEEKGEPRLIQTVRGVGYVMKEQVK